MKKLLIILILVLITNTLNAQIRSPRQIVKLNLVYKGKIYHNFRCYVLEVKGYRAKIVTSRRIGWVELLYESVAVAEAAINDYKEKEIIRLEKLVALNARLKKPPVKQYHGSHSRGYGSSGRVSVSGYYRKDGTYVRPHTSRRPRR